MNDHPFIVLEGTSGVGKSTVAKLLAARLHGLIVKTPLAPLDQIRDVVDRGMATTEGRHLFYLAAVVEASTQIRQHLAHSAVICDRYLLSTECYHRALGTSVCLDLARLDLVMPDLTILLTCEQAERIRRVDERGRSHNDRREEELGITERFQQEYLRHPVFIIDATHRGPKEIVNLILSELSHVRSMLPACSIVC